MEPGQEYKLTENYSNFQGTLLEGDEVTVDHIKDDKIHVSVRDAFNRVWVIPTQVLSPVEETEAEE